MTDEKQIYHNPADRYRISIGLDISVIAEEEKTYKKSPVIFSDGG
jgi:hypothetical protein